MSMQRFIQASVLVALGLTIGARAEAQTFPCATTTGSDVIAFRTRVVLLVTASDTGATARRAMYNVPQTTASKVSFVTTAGTCTTAGQAYYTALGVAAPAGATPVVVLKVSNNRYVVIARSHREGEFEVVVTFDTQWHALGEVAS